MQFRCQKFAFQNPEARSFSQIIVELLNRRTFYAFFALGTCPPFQSSLRSVVANPRKTFYCVSVCSAEKNPTSSKNFVIFTDGACSGNPGPGGWGAIVVDPDSQVRELGDFVPNTTNNRMELLGLVEALKLISSREGMVQVYSDSLYVLRGSRDWAWGWRKRNWKTAEGQDVINQDLWNQILQLILDRDKKNFQWNYCRGHQGVPGNERCDEIAVAFSKREPLSLFKGSLQNYSVSLFPLPEPQPWPELKAIGEKLAAFSYLSFLQGKVHRHKTWASCERRVKGQSGARFKKAMSLSEEGDILKQWGVNPGTVIFEEEN